MKPSTLAAVVSIWVAIFIAGITLIVGPIGIKITIGQTVGLLMIIISSISVIATVVYFTVRRIDEVHKRVDNSTNEIHTAIKTIEDAYKISTKELLQAASNLGLEMVYQTRAEVESEIIKRLLPHAKREVKFLGVCISIPFRMPKLNETIVSKAIEGVSFQFLFLKRTSRGDFDFYDQRAYDESFPKAPPGTLKPETAKHIKTLEAAKQDLPREAKGDIEVAEYRAFPYMSLIIIDDLMYVGSYLFGVNCPNMPIFKIRKEQKGIYDTYLDHFKALWKHTKELERDYAKEVEETVSAD